MNFVYLKHHGHSRKQVIIAQFKKKKDGIRSDQYNYYVFFASVGCNCTEKGAFSFEIV